MYKAKTTVVVKGYHPKAQRLCTAEHVTIASAETLPELKKKLADFFGRSWKHKKPMYRDTAEGAKRCGWVVGRRMDEGPGAKYLQTDWVSVTQCEAVEW